MGLHRVSSRLKTDSTRRENYLMSLSILPIRSSCSGQLWHTLREESEKLFAPRTRAAESMSNHAAFAVCCRERYFSMCYLLKKSSFTIYSAGAVSPGGCWQHEPQHPPVKLRIPAAAVALTTIIPINIPSCFKSTLPISSPPISAISLYIGKQGRIF